MAEVLAVVASGIAVVQIAGKAASTVVKLKQLWNQVKYVPEAIQDLMEQLECLEPALCKLEGRIETSKSLEGTPQTSSEHQSAIYCRKALDKLSDLAEQLSAQINQNQRRKRTVERVKVVLKKEQLKQAEASLNSVIRMLTIAQQCHVTTLLERQPEIMTKAVITTLQTFRDDHHKPTQNRLKGSIVREDSESAWLETTSLTTETWTRFGDSQRRRGVKWADPGLFGTFQLQSTSGGYSATFQPPWWLAGTLRAWEVEMNRSLAGWRSHLRAYSIRPVDSAPFKAVWIGDAKELRRLFTSGEASPFDRTSEGVTLLHIAAYFTQMAVLELFLELSLGDIAYERTTGNFQAMHMLAAVSLGGGRGREATFVDMFLAHLDISTGNHETEPSLCQCQAIHSAYALKRLQPIICPKHASTTLHSRIERCRTYGPPSTKCLALVLEPDWSRNPRQVCEQYAPEYPLVHAIACACGDSFWSMDKEHVADDAFVQEILRHSENLHSLERCADDKAYLTPFLALVDGFMCWIPPSRYQHRFSDLHDCMFQWLTALARAGVDLLEYGRCESSFLRNKKRRVKRLYWRSYLGPERTIKLRLVAILYGPKAEDWKLCWNEETDEFVGDFWDLVERGPSSTMPGSWDESNQDSDEDWGLDSDDYWDQDSDEDWDDDTNEDVDDDCDEYSREDSDEV